MRETEFILIRSEEVQEILSKRPGFIVRWGISLFLLILLLILTGSYFIKYPDVMHTTIVLTSQHPPISLVSKAEGKLTELFVQDKQEVGENALLAIIENPADHREVTLLKAQLKTADLKAPLTLGLQSYTSLGELQNAYTVFARSLNECIAFQRINPYKKKIESGFRQLEKYRLYYDRLLQQRQTLQEEFLLSKARYKADSVLHVQGAIPILELNNSKSILLQKKYALQGAASALAQTDIQIGDLERGIADLEMTYRQEGMRMENELVKSYENLLSQITSWEQRYMLTSPAKGRVSFTKLINKNQTVKLAEEVMLVVPEKSGNIMCKVKLPVYGSSKVKTGQPVNIKLVNYPYEEYGMLTGQVASISILPKDSVYLADVTFPKGLTSSYNRQFEFKQQMIGTAEIILEDRSFLERIFSKLKFLFQNHL